MALGTRSEFVLLAATLPTQSIGSGFPGAAINEDITVQLLSQKATTLSPQIGCATITDVISTFFSPSGCAIAMNNASV